MLAPGADAGQGLTFTYSGQTLTEIVHEDQEKVSYRYAAGTKLLTDVINVDGMRAHYEYTGKELYHVLSVKIYGMAQGVETVAYHLRMSTWIRSRW